MSGQDQTILEKNDKVSDSNEENKKQKQKRIIDIAAYNLEYKALEDIVFIVKGIDNDFEVESSPTDENGSAAVCVPEAGKYSVSLKEGIKGLEPADGKAKKVITFTDKDKIYKDGNIYHQGMFKFKESKDLEIENKSEEFEKSENKYQNLEKSKDKNAEKVNDKKDKNDKQYKSENLFLEAKNRFNKKTAEKNEDKSQEETPKLGRIFIQGKCGYLKNDNYKIENNETENKKSENINDLNQNKAETSQSLKADGRDEAGKIENININFNNIKTENENSSILKNTDTDNINNQNKTENKEKSENQDKENKEVINADSEIMHIENTAAENSDVSEIYIKNNRNSDDLNIKADDDTEINQQNEINNKNIQDLNKDISFDEKEKFETENTAGEDYFINSPEETNPEKDKEILEASISVEENEKSDDDYDFYDDIYGEKDYIKDFESAGGFNFRVSSSKSTSEKSSFKEDFHEHEFLEEVSADLYKSLSADEIDNSLDYMSDLQLDDAEYYKNMKFESKAIKQEDLIPEGSAHYEVQEIEDEEEINIIPIYQEDIKGTKMIASLVSSLMEKDRSEREAAEMNSANILENGPDDMNNKNEELLAVTINPEDVEIIEEDQGIHTSDMRMPYKDVEIHEENIKMQNENDKEINNSIEMASFGGAFAVKK